MRSGNNPKTLKETHMITHSVLADKIAGLGLRLLKKTLQLNAKKTAEKPTNAPKDVQKVLPKSAH